MRRITAKSDAPGTFPRIQAARRLTLFHFHTISAVTRFILPAGSRRNPCGCSPGNGESNRRVRIAHQSQCTNDNGARCAPYIVSINVGLISRRSPHAAQRNAGALSSNLGSPEYASLLSGYAAAASPSQGNDQNGCAALNGGTFVKDIAPIPTVFPGEAASRQTRTRYCIN